MTPQSVCDGSDAGTVADEVCKIGMTGPGGGLIFFVDYQDEYPTYDYLEASPISASASANFATSAALCGETSSQSCILYSIFPGDNSARYQLDSTYQGLFRGKAATEYIVSKFVGVTKSQYAAGLADDFVSPTFNGATKSDWWLPSLAELQKMKQNLQDLGLKYFTWQYMVSSSEKDTYIAWALDMRGLGTGVGISKNDPYPVYPVRGF